MGEETAIPLTELEFSQMVQRAITVPSRDGRFVFVRDEETAASLLATWGWPCEVAGCTGWRDPTSETDAPRRYTCRVCGFEEGVG